MSDSTHFDNEIMISNVPGNIIWKMISRYKVSVVVPVYNEEKTVGQVLKSLASFKSIDQVVCVDDGSKDRSYDEIKKFKGKIISIHYRKNRGKGYALYRGTYASKGDIIVFYDSDNVDVVESDFVKLVKTLLEGNRKMVIGNPRGVHQGGIYDSVSGERVFFGKDIKRIAYDFKDCRLGVEIYINFVFKEWTHITMECRHIEKFEKLGLYSAFWEYLKQGADMIRVWMKILGLRLVGQKQTFLF